MEVLNSMQPDLLELIEVSKLFPYLLKYGLLTTEERQMLQLKNITDYDKAQRLLSTILHRKGSEGEKNFVKALYELSKKQGNSGYTDVICKLQQKGIVISETSNDSTKKLAASCCDNQSITSFNIN